MGGLKIWNSNIQNLIIIYSWYLPFWHKPLLNYDGELGLNTVEMCLFFKKEFVVETDQFFRGQFGMPHVPKSQSTQG